MFNTCNTRQKYKRNKYTHGHRENSEVSCKGISAMRHICGWEGCGLSVTKTICLEAMSQKSHTINTNTSLVVAVRSASVSQSESCDFEPHTEQHTFVSTSYLPSCTNCFKLRSHVFTEAKKSSQSSAKSRYPDYHVVVRSHENKCNLDAIYRLYSTCTAFCVVHYYAFIS